MPVKTRQGAKQAAMNASAKFNLPDATAEQSKRSKVNVDSVASPTTSSSSARKDELTSGGNLEADMTNFKSHMKEMLCKGKHSAKDTQKASLLATHAGVTGVEDICKCGNSGLASKNLAWDVLSKLQKGSETPELHWAEIPTHNPDTGANNWFGYPFCWSAKLCYGV